jgi:hypothetical protein
VNLEEYKMGIPKRKNNIDVYNSDKDTYSAPVRRQELLDRITKSDSYLPDSILHDDLDMGMLDFIKENFKIVSDGEQIPIIPKILTIQRWAELENSWEFVDEDRNIKLPFIAIVRQPDVQPGTNPVTQRTIPDRDTFFYASVPTWDGTQVGADIYRIPQPVAVDITFEVTIVCTKFRELNKFNQKVLQKFSSRQAYTTVKGHYIPIILDTVTDSTPLDTIDGRRYYVQNYKFTMLGFLIDSDDFEIKPAISRFFLLNEFAREGAPRKKYINNTVDVTVITLPADGMQTAFSVGEGIGILFNVSVNGLMQERNTDYYHIASTSKVTFEEAPLDGSTVTITYYKGRNNVILDNYGKILQVATEYFEYNGSTLIFQLNNAINSIVSVDINGLQEEEGSGYNIDGLRGIKLLGTPYSGSRIGVTYLF